MISTILGTVTMFTYITFVKEKEYFQWVVVVP